jgi:hypothetical protein
LPADPGVLLSGMDTIQDKEVWFVASISNCNGLE